GTPHLDGAGARQLPLRRRPGLIGPVSRGATVPRHPRATMRRMDPATRDHLSVWVAAALAVIALAGMIAVVGTSAPAPPALAAATPAQPPDQPVAGLATFRGDATRTWYGQGPVPTDPVVRWTYPNDGSKMCSMSAEGGTGSPVKQWCGTGWTGQPNVVPLKDG